MITKTIFRVCLALAICVALSLPTFESQAGPSATLVLGQTLASNIGEPGEQDLYTFTGTAGQRLYYDALDLDFESINARLLSPSGGVVWEINHSSERGPFTLTETGLYTLVLDGNSDTVGDYAFRLDDLALAAALNIGAITSGELNPRSETDLYQFSGTAGQRIQLESISASVSDANWRLISPADEQLISGNINTDLGDVVLPLSGTYMVLVEGYRENATALSYQILLLDASEGPVTPSGLGVVRSGTIGAGQKDTNSFAAPAGMWVYLDSQDRSGNQLVIELRDPSGAVVFTVGAVNDSGPHVLGRSGSYQMIVRGSSATSTGSYRYRLLDLAAASALPLNNEVSGTLDPGLEVDVYQFSGRAGQRLYYDALDGENKNIAVQLLEPSRRIVPPNGNLISDVGPFTLAVGGTYYFLVEGAQANATTYRFRIFDVGSQESLPLDRQFNGTLNPGLAVKLYQLAGQSGQQFYFEGQGVNSQAGWYLYGPANEYVGGANVINDFEVTLPKTGTYVLALDGNGANAVPFTNQVVSFEVSSNSLILGATVAGTIAEPGEQDVYTFNGVTGQRLYYDALDGDFDSIGVQLFSPSGVNVSSRNADSDFGPFTLSETGTYSLVMDGSGATIGDYRFRLIDVAQAPARPLVLDSTLGVGLPAVPASALNMGGSYVNKSLRDYLVQDDWKVSQAIAGTRKDAQISFSQETWGDLAAVGVTGGTDNNWENYSVQWDGTITIANNDTHLYTRSDDGSRLWIDLNHDGVFESSGPELVDNNWGRAQGATLGPASAGLAPGTYAIRVQYEEGSGGNEMSLLWDGGVSLNPGTRADVFRFEGTAGQKLFFAGMGPSSAANWYLYGPGNGQIGGANITGDFEVTLNQSGTYLVVLDGNSVAAPVPYLTRVVTTHVSNTALALGAIITGTIAEPGEQAVYTFHGAAGQRLYYDALDGDFDAIVAQLFSPSGINVSSRNADSDFGPFTLSETGTYSLVIDGSGSTIGDYRFRLIDVAQAPARPLVLDSTLGVGLPAVPASALNVSGSYVNKSLRDYLVQDDWKVSQAIAGTRKDAQISFSQETWGSRAAVGVTGGADNNWENYSVQWDGTITIANNDTHLYTRSDDGSRLRIDLNHDGVFESSGPELVDNNWGRAQGATLGPASAGLAPGTYAIRVQYEEGSGGNDMSLLWDDGVSLDPGTRADVFRFEGTAGQRLFFDGMGPSVAGNWYLYGPDNAQSGGANITGDFEVTLNESGTYLVVLDGSNVAGPVPYAVRVGTFETPHDPLPLGSAITGTISEPGEQDFHTFTGTAGQRLYYDALDLDFESINARLLSPSGGVVWEINHSSERGPFTLTETGLYTLVLDGNSGSVGDYAFRLDDLALAVPLNFGTPASGELNPRSEADLYQFSGTAGQKIHLESISASVAEANWRLISPADEELISRNINTDLGDVVLPLSGIYVVLVDGSRENATGLSYQILLLDASEAPVTSSGLGVVRSGTIGAGQRDTNNFTAPSGVWVYLDSQDRSGNELVIELRDPSNAAVFTVGAANDSGLYFLGHSGSYQTIVRGSSAASTGSYRYRLLDLSSASTLPLNNEMSGTLDPGLEVDVYRLNGRAGQRLYYDALDGENKNITVQLLGPGGGIVHINRNLISDLGPFTLAVGGTYYFLVEGSQATASPYRFRLLDVGNQEALPLDRQFSGALDPGLAVKLYQLAGQIGQEFYFDGQGINNQANWYLYGPANEYVSGANAINDFEVTLPKTGTYVLALEGNGANAVPFTNQVVSFEISSNPLSLGAAVTGTISKPGEQDVYTFNGAAGQRLYYDALDLDSDAIIVQLFSPSGVNVFTHNSDFDFGPLTLNETGVYSLVFDGNGAVTGDYSFRLIDVSQAPARPWILDTAVEGTLDPGTRADVFRFEGRAGENLFFDGMGLSSTADWALYGPGNQLINQSNISGDFETTLDQAGSYIVVLDGNRGTNPVPYSVRTTTFERPSTPFVSGSTISGTLDEPGSQHFYKFQGALGQRLYYDALDGDFDGINVQIVSPDGTALFIRNSDSDIGPFTLVESGAYSLILDGNGAITGDYSFRLLDVLGQSNLLLDQAVTGTLDPGRGAAIYRFEGAAGQRMFFQSLGSDSGGSWTLYGPGNSAAQSANLVSSFELTLPETGAYALILDGNSPNPVPYSFKVITPNDNNLPPSISTIGDQSTQFNAALPPLGFTVGDSETAAANLAVTATSSNPALIPNANIILGGAGPNRTVSISPAVDQFGTALITLKVTDASGAQAAESFVVNVLGVPPTIIQQVQGESPALGASVVLRVVAEGPGPLSYQWRKNGVNLPGVTGPTLTLLNVQPGDAGNYNVAVANAFGAVNSQIATVVVPLDPLPMSNNLSDRVNFNGVQRVGFASNVGSTKEGAEPDHAGKSGGKSMWISWTAPANGIITFSTSGSGFDTLLAVYTGTSLGALTEVASDDDSGGFYTSLVSFNAVAGTTYQIAVDGLAGAEGTIVCGWNLEVTAEVVPHIITQPQSQTVALATNVLFTVGAQGQNLSYQWYFNEAAIAGATGNSLTRSDIQTADVGSYFARVSSGGRFADSDIASLQVNSIDGAATGAVVSDDKFADTVNGIVSVVTPQKVPSRRIIRRAAPSVARGFTGTQVFSTVGSAKEQGEPNHCGIVGGASQWFAYQAPASGTLSINTDGSSFDTVLAVYTGSGADFASLQSVACDNDSGLDGQDSAVSFPAVRGTVYYVAVDGVNAATGNVLLNYQLTGNIELSGIAAQSGIVRFRIISQPEQKFTIQGSTDLLSWLPLISTNSANGSFEFSDVETPSFLRRFYRAVSAP